MKYNYFFYLFEIKNTKKKAILIANGPDFKVGPVGPISNLDVYNLICDMMNIEPAPNNGTDNAIQLLLKNP